LRFGSGANLVKGGIFVVVLGNCRRWLRLGVDSSAWDEICLLSERS